MPSRLPPAILCFAALSVAAAARAHGVPEESPRAVDVTLFRLVMAHDVDEGEPVWADVPFIDDGERIYAFLEASNSATTPRRLTITVEGEGRMARRLAVTIPPRSTRHRTWAFLPAGVPSGQWTTTVRTSEGIVLEQVEFEVED